MMSQLGAIFSLTQISSRHLELVVPVEYIIILRCSLCGYAGSSLGLPFCLCFDDQKVDHGQAQYGLCSCKLQVFCSCHELLRVLYDVCQPGLSTWGEAVPTSSAVYTQAVAHHQLR